MKILINVLFYQVIWFSCVLLGNSGALVALVVLPLHLAASGMVAADLKMIGFLFAVGLLVDGTLQQIGFFTFKQPGFPIPIWLMAIWLGLAITPHHSLAWLKNRPLLSGLFGALGGPVAYWAGVRLGAASFSWPELQSLGLLALIWGGLWMVVMHFSVLSTTGVTERGDGGWGRS